MFGRIFELGYEGSTFGEGLFLRAYMRDFMV